MLKIIIPSLVILVFGLSMANMAIGVDIPGVDRVGAQNVSGLVDTFRMIVKWIYTIFFIIAVIYIIAAAFTYLTAGGEAEKVNTAKDQLIYAAVAIAVALLAISFDTIVKNFLSTGA